MHVSICVFRIEFRAGFSGLVPKHCFRGPVRSRAPGGVLLFAFRGSESLITCLAPLLRVSGLRRLGRSEDTDLAHFQA